MHVNIAKLKGKTIEKGMTGEMLAVALGINPCTYYRKLRNGGISFTLTEVFRLSEILEMNNNETMSIFFGQNSH